MENNHLHNNNNNGNSLAVLPRYLIIKIMNEVMNKHIYINRENEIQFRMTSLKMICRFIGVLSRVSHEWRYEIIPKLYIPRYHIQSEEYIGYIDYLIKLGIKSQITFRYSMDLNKVPKSILPYLCSTYLSHKNHRDEIQRFSVNSTNKEILTRLNLESTRNAYIYLLFEKVGKKLQINHLEINFSTLKLKDQIQENQILSLDRLVAYIPSSLSSLTIGSCYRIDSISSLVSVQSLRSLDLGQLEGKDILLLIQQCKQLVDLNLNFLNPKTEGVRNIDLVSDIFKELELNKNLERFKLFNTEYSILFSQLVRFFQNNHTITTLYCSFSEIVRDLDVQTQFDLITNYTISNLTIFDYKTSRSSPSQLFSLWSHASSIETTLNGFICEDIPVLLEKLPKLEKIALLVDKYNYSYLLDLFNQNPQQIKTLVLNHDYDPLYQTPYEQPNILGDLIGSNYQNNLQELFIKFCKGEELNQFLLYNHQSIEKLHIQVISFDIQQFCKSIIQNHTLKYLIIDIKLKDREFFETYFQSVIEILNNNSNLIILYMTSPSLGPAPYHLIESFEKSISKNTTIQSLNIFGSSAYLNLDFKSKILNILDRFQIQQIIN
ncbi:hypothetical protein DLAC_11057 [Tieghemostelium lacteum]|uniref:Uncharacterized protein n=1 Tax=Tieghemostelium lacteum TaxID=361077 RepID=A0A151Z359_TIELA|nr:hypothetical protein DLAC_11057 [Tieghemostelium lacteum]|eukprot:KYQ88357.1 hypothetical protein DLAC_11057 [Tieghemostelium lacteum]